jgi:hypothetical protein
MRDDQHALHSRQRAVAHGVTEQQIKQVGETTGDLGRAPRTSK